MPVFVFFRQALFDRDVIAGAHVPPREPVPGESKSWPSHPPLGPLLGSSFTHRAVA